MREIKFRAWDKMNHKMIHSPMAISSGEGGWVLFTSEINNLDCQQAIHDIRGYEIMQFTGLTDKNGKDVYEGDIVGTPGDTDYSGVVRFGVVELDVNGGEYEVSINGFYVDTGLSSNRTIVTEWMNRNKSEEIIGNIYENPEVLSTG